MVQPPVPVLQSVNVLILRHDPFGAEPGDQSAKKLPSLDPREIAESDRRDHRVHGPKPPAEHLPVQYLGVA